MPSGKLLALRSACTPGMSPFRLSTHRVTRLPCKPTQERSLLQSVTRALTSSTRRHGGGSSRPRPQGPAGDHSRCDRRAHVSPAVTFPRQLAHTAPVTVTVSSGEGRALQCVTASRLRDELCHLTSQVLLTFS